MSAFLKFFVPILLAVIISSCAHDDIDPKENSLYGKGQLKEEVVGGKTTTKFVYNSDGKIAEKESLYFYERYIYDKERLVKIESAMDPAMLSSNSSVFNKTELMTSENSVISSYSILKYDQKEKLSGIETYFDKDGTGDFVYTSMQDFEYNGQLISKCNLYNAQGEITQYHTYEYDNRGNVKNEKYYSYLFLQSTSPQIVSEASFEYDDKKNPFAIFRSTGRIGMTSNTNNIIEVHSKSYTNTPGIPDTSIGKTSYEYNPDGYPVKVIRENDSYEYRY